LYNLDKKRKRSGSGSGSEETDSDSDTHRKSKQQKTKSKKKTKKPKTKAKSSKSKLLVPVLPPSQAALDLYIGRKKKSLSRRAPNVNPALARKYEALEPLNAFRSDNFGCDPRLLCAPPQKSVQSRHFITRHALVCKGQLAFRGEAYPQKNQLVALGNVCNFLKS